MANNYINNSDFLKALTEYKEDSLKAQVEGKPVPRVPDYIGECFLKMAEHISRKPNFVSYSFRDEMVADGVENSLRYFRNFDPEKSSNPFAYFSQTIFRAFWRRIAKEKKQLYAKYKLTEQAGILDEGSITTDQDGYMKQFEIYSNITDFIVTFEESEKKKKKIIKENKKKKENEKVIDDFILMEK